MTQEILVHRFRVFLLVLVCVCRVADSQQLDASARSYSPLDASPYSGHDPLPPAPAYEFPGVEDARHSKPQPAGNSISLANLLQQAKNNLSLMSKRLLVEQAEKEVSIYKISYVLPRLDINYFITGSQKGSLDYTTQFVQASLNFNLFNGFADYNTIKSKNAVLRSKMNEAKFAEEHIHLQVVHNYYLYFNHLSHLLSLQQKFKQINAEVERIQKLYKQGLKTADDLEALKSQTALTQHQIDSARLNLERSKLMLEYLANTKIENLERVNIKHPTYRLDQRADITSLHSTIESLRLAAKSSSYYPVVDIQGTYTYNVKIPYYVTGVHLSNPFFGSNFARYQNQVMLVLKYGMLDKISMSLQRQALRLQEIASQHLLSYKIEEQKKDEKLYRLSIELAKSQVKTAKSSLDSANLSFNSMKKKYSSNLVTFTDYLRALSAKYDAEFVYIQSLNDYELQKANYIFHSGQDLEAHIIE